MSNSEENQGTLVVERVFAHPVAKLWRALTESHWLAQWMMNNDFVPEVGHQFQFRAEPVPQWNGIVDCQVREVEPLRKLTYLWGVGGTESGMEWVVEFTLTETAEGTKLRMEQSGFRPEQRGAYQGAKYGWQRFIGNLERVLGEMA